LSILIRKISRAKWPEQGVLTDIADIPGDAITADLRTTANTLSFWAVKDIDELKNVIVALATVPTAKGFDSIPVIWIDEDTIKQFGLGVNESIGITAAKHYADNHRDLVELTYSSLGTVAGIVMSAINDGQYERVTTSKVKDYTREAYRNGEIDLDLLHDAMKEKIKKL